MDFINNHIECLAFVAWLKQNCSTRALLAVFDDEDEDEEAEGEAKAESEGEDHLLVLELVRVLEGGESQPWFNAEMQRELARLKHDPYAYTLLAALGRCLLRCFDLPDGVLLPYDSIRLRLTFLPLNPTNFQDVDIVEFEEVLQHENDYAAWDGAWDAS